ncbi:hypothetical protein TNCV_2572141 [Trichonephila clavipes]|nr:hypothetical protein TNCV_2572141 [Trichonephila clavipes]
MGSLVVTVLDSRPEGLDSMPVATRSTCSLNQRVQKSCGLNNECRELENIFLPFISMSKLWRWKQVVSQSIVPSGNFVEIIRTVICMVIKAKANNRRTSSPLPG